ncbi:DUF6343 family protein [Jiangella gansuensis]|uniref:DUF6343 family protein n=1 Tax=Jiangella gansuensis TaxID=281473 RepID=UPI0012FCEE65|nr:DUF6343 family protein [Jiangella gansuensis]
MTQDGEPRPLDPSDHEPTGTEPVQARSAYRLRLAFAAVGFALGIAGIIGFGRLMTDDRDPSVMWLLVLSALVVVTAALDIAVILRRRIP